MKEGLPPVIRKLIRWREKNGLSQRAASEVMLARDCAISLAMIQSWEQGKRQPGRMASKVLLTFLKDHPIIENPPVYRPGPPKK